MGLFKRLHRITIGRIEAFLDRAEDPEILFPALIREMESQVQNATEAEAKARAALRRAEREVTSRTDRIHRLGRGAEQALRANEESTARTAIEAQLDCERVLQVAKENLDRAQDTLDHATAARKHIQQQLSEMRSRKDEILTRARVAKAKKKIQCSVSGSIGSTDSILDAVARLEEGVEEMEAQLDIQASLTGHTQLQPSLERRLRELDMNVEVEKRIAALRESIEPKHPALA